MPKEAARLFLKVTNVRVERLQDMLIKAPHTTIFENIANEGVPVQKLENGKLKIDINDFIVLWNSTIKKADLDKYGWEANPWVWVIEFERVEV